MNNYEITCNNSVNNAKISKFFQAETEDDAIKLFEQEFKGISYNNFVVQLVESNVKTHLLVPIRPILVPNRKVTPSVVNKKISEGNAVNGTISEEIVDEPKAEKAKIDCKEHHEPKTLCIYGEDVVVRLGKVSGFITGTAMIFGASLGYGLGFVFDIVSALQSGDEPNPLWRILCPIMAMIVAQPLSKYITLIFDWMSAILENIQEQSRNF